MSATSWLYGAPAQGDISDFRFVRMEFCASPAAEYIMHKDHVPRFVEASVKLHHNPGVNPGNGQKTAPIWRITSAPLHVGTYWWTTPNLQGNDDPEGAAIVKGGKPETLFVDHEYVDRLNRLEAEIEGGRLS